MTSNLALIVEDDVNTADAFSKMLSGMGFTVHIAHTLHQATAQLAQLSPAIVLLDVGLPDGSGLSLLNESYVEDGKSAPKFVVITGDSSQQIAVQCLRAQVDDFLTKPVTLQSLRGCFGKLSSSQRPANDGEHTEHTEHTEHAERTSVPSVPRYRYQETVVFTGHSRAAKQLREEVMNCASSRLNGIVIGGAGTYKQHIAYAVHDQSGRRGKFIPLHGADLSLESASLNSRTVSADLAFDGILERYLEAARNGTLFINDLSAVPLSVQHLLMKWCDTNQSFEKLDSSPVLLATLHGQADALIDAGLLSAELYYRLAQYVIRAPDLKERVLDMSEMVGVMIDTLNKSHHVRKTIVSTEIERLKAYEWPGNIRELENVIKQSFASRDPKFIIANHLIPTADAVDQGNNAIEVFIGKTFWETEKALLFATLESVNGDKTLAAEMLGISLKTLYNRLNAYS